jgi:uncharacterized protein YndB with AHSA1/START domain
MTTPSANATATLTYTVSIEAPPAAVWDAITTPEQSDRYGYKGRVEYALRPGGRFAHHPGDEMAAHGSPDPLIDGEVLEVDAPHRLVQTWNPLFGSPITEEPPTRLVWEIADEDGSARVTLTHHCHGAPLTARLVSGSVAEMGGGWPYVLGDLKTFLETGATLRG